MRKRKPSWPPVSHYCPECGFTTYLISKLLNHMQEVHINDE